MMLVLYWSAYAQPLPFDQQYWALRENTDLIAQCAPIPPRILKINPMRAQDDQLNTHFHGIADDFLGTIAKDDLLASRHMHFFELSSKSGEMIPRNRLMRS